MRLALPVGLLAAALAAVVFLQLSRGGARSGFPAPDFALTNLDGRTVRLSDFRGKIVFLNLWATWCPPCREEMPSMEQLHRRFESQGLVMLAVSEDSDVSAVRPFVNEMKLT
ncbi:MAG TPA: TlpA disulfide reductase family protein, partial [Candidatus Acidoferrales bacterium]|nr:TlpA disulfide reductase family protein [Candidatus Acidoferrales bacterium]